MEPAVAFTGRRIRLALLIGIIVFCAGCVLHDDSTDATRGQQASGIVGKCFRLKLDAGIVFFNEQEIIVPDRRKPSTTIRIDGRLRYDRRLDASPAPKGSRFVVEHVVSRYMTQVGTAQAIYVRGGAAFNGGLFDASSLFEDIYGDAPLMPIRTVLEPCDQAIASPPRSSGI